MADFPFTLNEGVVPESDPETDGVYELNDDMVVEAINNLIELFKNGPRNQVVLGATVGQVQELENNLWLMYAAFTVDTAVGEQLDFLGNIVGELRQGRVDSDYRAAVRVRVLVNLSSGTIPELLEICYGLVPTADVTLQEVANMTIAVHFSVLTGTTLRTVYQILRQAKAAGVRLLLTYGGNIGAVDGDPAGGTIGAVDGNPAGFIIGGGT